MMVREKERKQKEREREREREFISSFSLTFTELIQLATKDAIHLRYLNVSGCHALSSRSVFKIAQNCRNLEIVKLCDVTNVREAAVVALIQNCPKIEVFDISGLEDVRKRNARSERQWKKKNPHILFI
jgi:hypothetical protein